MFEKGDFRNPFKDDNLEKIHMWYTKGIGKEFKWSANVYFKLGNTEGTQTFNKYDSLNSLTKAIDKFLKNT